MIHNIKHEWLPNGNFRMSGEESIKDKYGNSIKYFIKEYTKKEIEMFNKLNISIYEDFIQWCHRI